MGHYTAVTRSKINNLSANYVITKNIKDLETKFGIHIEYHQ